MILFGLICLGVMLYPFFQDALNDYLDQELIQYYQQQVNKENDAALEKAKAEMEAQNAVLAKSGNLPGVEEYTAAVEEEVVDSSQPSAYYQTHTIAVLTIPSIRVSLPIFDETNEVLLQKGAALLSGTSYPVGGQSTHAVLSAHRGLPEAKLFTDLPKLKVGDEFYIDINDERLAYQVESTEVILPTETDKLLIKKGADLVTLMTCTPYMLNTHRLLVTGHRVPYKETAAKKIKTISWWKTNQIYFWFIGGLAVSGGLLYGLYRWLLAGAVLKQRQDITLTFYDQKGQPLTATFLLLDRRGKQPIYRNEQPLVLQTDAKGRGTIPNLRGGSYMLRPENAGLQAAFRIRKRHPNKDFFFEYRKTFPGHHRSDAKGEIIYYDDAAFSKKMADKNGQDRVF